MGLWLEAFFLSLKKNIFYVFSFLLYMLVSFRVFCCLFCYYCCLVSSLDLILMTC